jgi:hypothetical protein
VRVRQNRVHEEDYGTAISDRLPVGGAKVSWTGESDRKEVQWEGEGWPQKMGASGGFNNVAGDARTRATDGLGWTLSY